MEANTLIDLFAGCGGSSLGFKRAGFVLKAAVELDPITCRSYADNHPEATLLINDIRLLSAQDILEKAGLGVGQCTVVLGCPPCQGFSRHRLKGSGLNDPRNSLVSVFAEMVISMLPTFFVFENVPGIVKIHESPWYAAKERLTALIPKSAQQTGENLVNTLLSPKTPVLSISTDQRERAAFHRIMLGVLAYLRNPFHHQIDDAIEWSWAWSIVGFIDHLLHELQNCEELK